MSAVMDRYPDYVEGMRRLGQEVVWMREGWDKLDQETRDRLMDNVWTEVNKRTIEDHKRRAAEEEHIQQSYGEVW